MTPTRGSRPRSEDARSVDLMADRLYLAVLHLLRRMRREDVMLALGAAELSALTTLVRLGPQTLGELAESEGVRPPTISRLVKKLEEKDLVVRSPSKTDRRVTRVRHSSRAIGVLEKGRSVRVASLAARLKAISAPDRQALIRGVEVMEALYRKDD